MFTKSYYQQLHWKINAKEALVQSQVYYILLVQLQQLLLHVSHIFIYCILKIHLVDTQIKHGFQNGTIDMYCRRQFTKYICTMCETVILNICPFFKMLNLVKVSYMTHFCRPIPSSTRHLESVLNWQPAISQTHSNGGFGTLSDMNSCKRPLYIYSCLIY